jgi:hypothetical protein
MPAKNARTEAGGFSAEERAAMKMRAAELRAEGKKGARKADGLQSRAVTTAGRNRRGARGTRRFGIIGLWAIHVSGAAWRDGCYRSWSWGSTGPEGAHLAQAPELGHSGQVNTPYRSFPPRSAA